MKLTERKIAQLTAGPSQKDRLVFDDEQRGLAVRVTARGSRTYLVQYTQHGTKHRLPLGPCSGLSLESARQAASAIRGEVAKGRNPAIERKEAAAAAKAKGLRDRHTLRTLVDDWRRLHLVHKRPRYAAEATRALEYAFSRYLDRPADALDRAAVVRVIDGLGGRRKPANAVRLPVNGSAIAGRTVAYGKAAYSWAMKRGAVAHNPFANLPAIARVANRERVLIDKELAAVWRTAGASSFPYGSIVRMLILTGQRRDEVAGMTWSEISDDLTAWTIPGARTKNGVAHIVPLNKPVSDLLRTLLPKNQKDAKKVLSERKRKGMLVLPGESGTRFSGWSKSKARLDKSCGVSDWRLHDLRRTLATGLQRLGVRLEVTEAVLNHVGGSRAGIVGVYQRHDWANEKRAALEAWVGHVLTIVEGRQRSQKVTPLHATA